MSASDEELRELFADLRAEDSARAPQFSAVLDAAAERTPAAQTPSRTRYAWWLLAAASVVMSVAIIARHARRHTEAVEADVTDAAAYPSIESWTAPTDALLSRARGPIIIPVGTGSVLDGVTGGVSSTTSFK